MHIVHRVVKTITYNWQEQCSVSFTVNYCNNINDDIILHGYYGLWPTPWVIKNKTPNSRPYLRQILINFQNYFTPTLSRKLTHGVILLMPVQWSEFSCQSLQLKLPPRPTDSQRQTAADCYEPVVLQHIMWSLNEQLDPRCNMQTHHHPSQLQSPIDNETTIHFWYRWV